MSLINLAITSTKHIRALVFPFQIIALANLQHSSTFQIFKNVCLAQDPALDAIITLTLTWQSHSVGNDLLPKSFIRKAVQPGFDIVHGFKCLHVLSVSNPQSSKQIFSRKRRIV